MPQSRRHKTQSDRTVPRHGTRVRVLFDDQALWVGVEALDSAPEAVRKDLRNHGGGHYNHTLFWQSMKKGGGKPAGELAKALQEIDRARVPNWKPWGLATGSTGETVGGLIGLLLI